MSIDDLVQTIVREVLRQLRHPVTAPQVLILARPDDKVVAPLLAHLGSDREVVYFDDVESTVIPDRVIVPLLTCSQMADLALGRATDPRQKKILDLLLAGKSVEVFEFEYTQFTKSAPVALRQLYECYEETLRSFGLQKVIREDVEDDRINLRLITERDVIEAHQRGVSILRLHAETQLTPLAIDCAKERGVQLRKDERRDK